MAMGYQEQPDLTLRAVRGSKSPKWDSYGEKYAIECHVWFPGRNAHSHSDGYDHPSIKICVVTPSGSTIESASLIYQRSTRIAEMRSLSYSTDVDKSLLRHWDAGRSSGFMGERGRWSKAYGAHWEIREESGAFGARALDLADRARKAIRKSAHDRYERTGKRRDEIPCDLLRMLIGLRLIGLTVKIWSPAVREARAYRPARPARVIRAPMRTSKSSRITSVALRNAS